MSKRTAENAHPKRKLKMKHANRNVIFLAAFVWFSGGIALLLKGSALDLSICTGLLVSSVMFWKLRAFSLDTP